MPDETTQEELEAQGAEARVYFNVDTPVNAAVAANVLSNHSTGYANVEQTADRDHGT